MEMNNDYTGKDNTLPVCPICGNTMPQNKTICWCCEHEPKLGLNQTCGKDSCEINFNEKE